MAKTIQSLIAEAEIKERMWLDIADDNEALSDRLKSREQALQLANFYEGRRDGLCDALPFITK